jgi:hypothetical protein
MTRHERHERVVRKIERHPVDHDAVRDIAAIEHEVRFFLFCAFAFSAFFAELAASASEAGESIAAASATRV